MSAFYGASFEWLFSVQGVLRQAVNEAVKDLMEDIHAFSIKKVLTPEQWEQQQ